MNFYNRNQYEEYAFQSLRLFREILKSVSVTQRNLYRMRMNEQSNSNRDTYRNRYRNTYRNNTNKI